MIVELFCLPDDDDEDEDTEDTCSGIKLGSKASEASWRGLSKPARPSQADLAIMHLRVLAGQGSDGILLPCHIYHRPSSVIAQ